MNDPRKERELNLRTIRAYAQLLAVMRDAMGRLQNKQAPRTAVARSAMQELFEETLDREWLVTALARFPRAPDATHQRLCAVAAYVLVLTRRLLLSPADAVELCTAALFHDLSMLPGEPMPPGALGARSVVRSLSDPPTDEVLHQATVALEWLLPPAGSGPTARFIAVPSMFELLSQPGPGRPAVEPDDAMRLLPQLSGERLDDVVVHLFVRHFGFYPPGTAVRLNDATFAIVRKPPRDGEPLDQPTVRRYDKAFANTDIDLRGDPSLAITGAVPPTLNPLRAWID